MQRGSEAGSELSKWHLQVGAAGTRRIGAYYAARVYVKLGTRTSTVAHDAHKSLTRIPLSMSPAQGIGTHFVISGGPNEIKKESQAGQPLAHHSKLTFKLWEVIQCNIGSPRLMKSQLASGSEALLN
jgi:hypothetical protein